MKKLLAGLLMAALPYTASALNTTVTLKADTTVTPTSSELVTFGLPLAEGEVFDTDEIRVLIGGIEQPVYVEPGLMWHWRDNSVRSVTIQLQGVDMTSGDVVVTVTDAGRNTANDLTEQPHSGGWTSWAGTPAKTALGSALPYPRILPFHDLDYVANSGLLSPYQPDPDGPYALLQVNQFNTWARDLNYEANSNAQWEYDRASAMFKAYLNSGNPEILREAFLGKQFYFSYVRNDGTPPAMAGGDGCWTYGSTACADGKYIYPEGAELALALFGDSSQWDNSLIVEMALQADLGWNQPSTRDPLDRGDGSEAFTERAVGMAGKAELVAYRITGNATVLANMEERLANMKEHQQVEPLYAWETTCEWLPKSGAIDHSWFYHEGPGRAYPNASYSACDSDDRRFSPWMSGTMAEWLWGVYHTLDHVDAPEMLRRLGNAIDLYGFTSAYVSGEGVSATFAFRPGYELGYQKCEAPDPVAVDVMYSGSKFADPAVMVSAHRSSGFTDLHIEVVAALAAAHHFETDPTARTRLAARIEKIQQAWTKTPIGSETPASGVHDCHTIFDGIYRLYNWQHISQPFSTWAYVEAAGGANIDPVPSAKADPRSVTEGTGPNTFNVMSNDNLGDTPTTVTSVTYGGNPLTLGTEFIAPSGLSVTFSTDGTLVYSAVGVSGLTSSVSEVFTYTITDSESDTSTSTVTLTLLAEGGDPGSDPDPEPGAGLWVFVAGAGCSDNQIWHYQCTDSSTWVSIDDYENHPLIAVCTVPESSTSCDSSTNRRWRSVSLLETGDAVYQCATTPSAPQTGRNDCSAANALYLPILEGGGSDPDPVPPTTVNDTNNAVEGGSAVTGNVLSNDTNATSVSAAQQGSTPITLGTSFVTAGGGSLTLQSTGAYSYTPPVSGVETGGIVESFQYIAANVDGAATGTLTINVADSTPTEPTDDPYYWVWATPNTTAQDANCIDGKSWHYQCGNGRWVEGGTIDTYNLIATCSSTSNRSVCDGANRIWRLPTNLTPTTLVYQCLVEPANKTSQTSCPAYGVRFWGESDYFPPVSYGDKAAFVFDFENVTETVIDVAPDTEQQFWAGMPDVNADGCLDLFLGSHVHNIAGASRMYVQGKNGNTCAGTFSYYAWEDGNYFFNALPRSTSRYHWGNWYGNPNHLPSHYGHDVDGGAGARFQVTTASAPGDLPIYTQHTGCWGVQSKCLPIDYDGDGVIELVTRLFGGGIEGTGPWDTGHIINAQTGALILAPTNPEEEVFAGALGVADLNNDGWPDVIHSGAGGWWDLSTGVPVWNGSAGLGIDTSSANYKLFFDFDSDGDLDFYQAQMPYGGGNGAGPLNGETPGWPSYFVQSLYENDGDGNFTDITASTNLNSLGITSNVHSSYANATVADMNLDGFPDIVLSALTNTSTVGNTAFLLNNGDGTFALESTINFGVATSGSGKAWVNVGDWDNDGKIDVVKTHASQSPTHHAISVWKNWTNLGNNRWLRIRAKGYGANTDGLHTRIVIRNPNTGSIVTSYQVGDFSDGHQNMLVHAGVGELTTVDLEVHFPHGGPSYTYQDVTTNQDVLVDYDGDILLDYRPGAAIVSKFAEAEPYTGDTGPVNKLPNVNNDTRSVNEGGVVITGNLCTNDDMGDPPSGITSVVEVATSSTLTLGSPFITAGGGSVTIASNCAYSYTSPLGVGVDGISEVFEYTVTDVDLDSDIGVFTVNVDDVPIDPGPGEPVVVTSWVVSGVTFRVIEKDAENCLNEAGCYQVLAEGETVFTYPALGKLHTSIVNYEGGATATEACATLPLTPGDFCNYSPNIPADGRGLLFYSQEVQ